MALELVTPLPPGAPSHTRLARHGARLVVLREIKDGTDCSWPQPSPNMVTLQEVGELQGKRHALFPWVPGVTLRELVKALEVVGKPVPIGLAGRVLVDAARALASITPARAHGGIQDGALQLGFDGKVSVLDFGAPRVSRFRPLGRVNFAADVFALGGVLHAVLTGFAGDYASPPVTLATPSTSHSEATPAIDDVVMRALSAQPDSRQSGAATFADELEAVLGPELFSAQGLSEMVSALFKDRIKVLHSLGGLVEDQPSLEAELPGPMPGIPLGTQPAWGAPRLEPPSEPTLPRIVTKEGPGPSLGDDPLERTETKIPAPARSMVPWDSNEGLTAASAVPDELLTRPSSGPPLSGARPDADTNPRGAAPRREAELDTNPRASAPPPRRLPADTDETSGPVPVRASAPRPLGAEGEHAPTRAGGPRALSRNEMEAARPRPSASRPPVFDDESGKTAAIDLPDDTNPRALPPEDTAPRARPPARRPEEEPEDTGPSPRPRNTTEAERYRAKGQERLPTPPQGLPVSEVDEEEAQDDLLNEPTAVRARPDPRMTAQTAQTLLPAPAPASSGAGLRVLMVVLLLVVVGLAGAIVLKLKRQSEQPLPLDESVLEVLDAGEAPGVDAGLAAALAELDLDGGDEEEEEEEEDGGELDADAGLDGGAADAGTADAGLADGGVADGGAADAGPKVVKKVVKKVKKKRKKRRRRR